MTLKQWQMIAHLSIKFKIKPMHGMTLIEFIKVIKDKSIPLKIAS